MQSAQGPKPAHHGKGTPKGGFNKGGFNKGGNRKPGGKPSWMQKLTGGEKSPQRPVRFGG